MPGEILVPVNGTAESARALPVALALARALDADVRLVRVLEVPSGPLASTAIAPGVAEALAAIRARVRRALTRAADEITALGLRGTASVLEGADVAGHLLRHAAERGARMLVMATRARGAAKQAVVGSVADRVMQDAEIPVVLVPVQERVEARPITRARAVGDIATALHAVPPVRTILVPVDSSPHALYPLEVLYPAAARAEEVILLHVVVQASLIGIVSPESADIGRSLAHDLEDARDRLERVAARLRAEIPALSTEVMEASDPPAAITALARERGADLIAMSTRGEGGLKRALFGSTASDVLRSATTPVLLVTPRSAHDPTLSA